MLPPAVRSGVVPPQLVAVVLVVAGGLAAAAGFGAGQPDGSLPSAPSLQFAGFAAVAAGFVALAAGLVALAAGLVGVAAAVVTGFFVGVAALVPALADAVVVAGLALVFDDAAVLLAEPLVAAVLVAGFFVTCFFLAPLLVVVVVVVDEAEESSSLLEPSRNFLVVAWPAFVLDACLAAASCPWRACCRG